MSIIPKVLIIDDDRFFREFCKAELSQYQILLDFAEDGETGFQKATTFLPDLILLDVILPKEDGFEVLKKLKANSQTKDIPVIIISSLSSPEDMKKLKDLGAIGSFNKLVTLPNQIAAYIAKRFKVGFKEKPQV